MKKNRYKSIIAFCILALLLNVSCNTVNKREKLGSEMKSHFQENQEMYNFLKEYLFKTDSYYGFTFNYKNDRITLKQGGIPLEIDSINQVVNNKDVYDILMFMKEENIRDVSSNKEWITITFEDFKYPCFSFWFRTDFDPKDENTIQKINNFKNKESKNWIFILKDKWYIKGEACF